MPPGPRRRLVAALCSAEAVIGVAILSVFAGLHDGSVSASSEHEHAAAASASRTLATGSAPHITVDDRVARVLVTAWDASSVQIDDHASHGRVAPLSIEQSGNEISIVRPSGEHRWLFHHHSRVTLVLHVPRAARMSIRHSNGATLHGINAPVSVRASNGRIEVVDHDGDIDATTSNAVIAFENVRAGSASARTSNGSVSFENVRAARALARTSNASIELDRLRTGALDAQTSNANVHATGVTIDGTGASGTVATSNAEIAFSGTLGSSGGYRFSSSNGDIHLVLPRNADLTIDAKAQRGGIAASEGVAFSGDARDPHRVARLGDGRAPVMVATSNASVIVRTDALLNE